MQQPKNHKKLTKKQQQKPEQTQKTYSQPINPLNNQPVDNCRTQTTTNNKNYKKSQTKRAGQVLKLANLLKNTPVTPIFQLNILW
jgi:hypothetical protein